MGRSSRTATSPYRDTFVPRSFWKFVAYVEQGKLKAQGFVLTQDDLESEVLVRARAVQPLPGRDRRPDRHDRPRLRRPSEGRHDRRAPGRPRPRRPADRRALADRSRLTRCARDGRLPPSARAARASRRGTPPGSRSAPSARPASPRPAAASPARRARPGSGLRRRSGARSRPASAPCAPGAAVSTSPRWLAAPTRVPMSGMLPSCFRQKRTRIVLISDVWSKPDVGDRARLHPG